jgi:phage baseplate assembly protein W
MVSYEHLGTDIKADWSFTDGDINLISEKSNLGQAIVNRLKSDLTTFIFYNRYGGNLFEHFGDKNNPNIHEYIKIEVESICRQDPRIKQVETTVNKTDSETITLDLKLLTISSDEIIRYNLILNSDNSIFINENSSELSERS